MLYTITDTMENEIMANIPRGLYLKTDATGCKYYFLETKICVLHDNVIGGCVSHKYSIVLVLDNKNIPIGRLTPSFNIDAPDAEIMEQLLHLNIINY